MRTVGFLASMALLAAAVSVADDETTLADAIADGDARLSFRYRYEYVDEEGFDDNANASTLRTRLNFESKPWRGWSGLIEFDHVLEAGIKDYNSGAGTSGEGRARYPVVADPGGPDLNQMYVQYAPNGDWQTRIGRQRIILDDQRFVGGVGWRQNEQTYDSVSVRYGGWDNAAVSYSYVANVARIFGDSVSAGSHEQSTHLLNAHVELSENLRILGYAYLIDNADAPVFSTRTVGIRAEGAVAVGDGRLSLLGELATQDDYGNAPTNFDTDYFRLQALWKVGAFTAGAGFESMGSDDGEAFRTPLATLHAFNGWADRFLTTPADGLVDRYVRLGYTHKVWNFQATWHAFDAETGSTDFGSEIDLSAQRKLGERYALLLKLASFYSDSDSLNDATKAWVMVSAGF